MFKPIRNLVRLQILLYGLTLLACGRVAPDKQAPSPVVQGVMKELIYTGSFSDSWSTNNRVEVHLTSDPDNLHPFNGYSQNRSEINYYLQASVLYTDLATASIRPGLAREMPKRSSDFRQLRFCLRDSIFWDNGAPIRVEDIIFTARASKFLLTDNQAYKPYWDKIASVEPVSSSPDSFVVNMKEPYILDLAVWADYPILQRTYYDPENLLAQISWNTLGDSVVMENTYANLQQWAQRFNSESFGFNPDSIQGAGPYRLKSWEIGRRLVLEKKKGHWTSRTSSYFGSVSAQEIVYRINKDPYSQKLEFLKQEFDASSSFNTRGLLELSKDSIFLSNYHYAFMDTYGYTYLAMNMKPANYKRAPALSHREVRNAIAYLTPVEEMIQVVNGGVNKRVNGPVSFLKPSYDQSVPLIPFSVDSAILILETAGWNVDEDGVRSKLIGKERVRLDIEFSYLNTQPEWKEMAMMIAEAAASAGIKLRLKAYEHSVWLDKMVRHDFDLGMGSWGSSSLPDDFSQIWHTSSAEGGLNFSGFGDRSSDQMIDSLQLIFDETARVELEKRIQRRIREDQPYVFMYGLVRRCILHKRFVNGVFYAERPGILYHSLKVPDARSNP